MSRSHLLSLLSEACELEHMLACSYLYAGFSLKRGQADGLSWREEQTVRRWAAQVYFVASQEMFHLAQAWNLLTAFGGTPYYTRPAFPQVKGYSPIDAEMTLSGYSPATLDRFLRWEHPAQAVRRAFPIKPRPADPDALYRTVGELYQRIEKLIEETPERDLCLGDPELQVGPEHADFRDLIRVVDRRSALEAVHCITRQGEGVEDDREDCHYGIFFDLRAELDSAGFAYAHPVLENPSYSGEQRVTDLGARAAMRLFDDVYATMLQLLGWVFGPGDPRSAWTKAAARAGIAAMPLVLKPLGEALAALPSGVEGRTAGAAFGSMRHVPLPASEPLARRLVAERMVEIKSRAVGLLEAHPGLSSAMGWLPGQLERVTTLASR